MSTLTITEFLEARINEDEAMARECEESGAWSPFRSEEHLEWWVRSENFGHIVTTGYVGNNDAKPNAEHIARHDPARVLAECAAKRAIIGLAKRASETEQDFDDYEWQGTVKRSEPLTGDAIIFTIAAVYKDHPDYQPEWAL